MIEVVELSKLLNITSSDVTRTILKKHDDNQYYALPHLVDDGVIVSGNVE